MSFTEDLIHRGEWTYWQAACCHPSFQHFCIDFRNGSAAWEAFS